MTIKKQNNIPHNVIKLINTSQRVLLLQGFIGYFFQELADYLSTQHQKTVFKIHFNAGDEWFYPVTRPHTYRYTDTPERFATYLQEFIQTHHIDTIVCFGDTRFYHREAKRIIQQLGGNFWAFEEGYFRPAYITLEETGVNAFSPLPQQASFFRENLVRLASPHYQPPCSIQHRFSYAAWIATCYYVAMRLGKHRYPHYQHHRPSGLWYYTSHWIWSGIKRLAHIPREYFFRRQVKNGDLGRFFILPLQVFNDTQVTVHSNYDSIQDFMLHVLTSFAQHAPNDVQLVIKHHPMDRGFTNYKQCIRQFIAHHPHCAKRIHYVYDIPLPVFLRKATGMVTLNSTSALSALLHQLPVKVMGKAHYDFPELTDPQPLDSFWKTPVAPDMEVFHAFRQYHLNVTQINGSFMGSILWP